MRQVKAELRIRLKRPELLLFRGSFSFAAHQPVRSLSPFRGNGGARRNAARFAVNRHNEEGGVQTSANEAMDSGTGPRGIQRRKGASSSSMTPPLRNSHDRLLPLPRVHASPHFRAPGCKLEGKAAETDWHDASHSAVICGHRTHSVFYLYHA